MTLAPRDAAVLMIGAGPTGLTLANLLGRMGVATVLAERNAGTVEEPRAVSIDDESMRTMQAAGLRSQVEAIVASGYGSRYLSPRGRVFATVDPTSREYGFDKRNAFQQPQLEALLRKGLDRFPHVTQLFGHELESLRQDQAGVSAVLKRANGPEVEIRSRFLVGCDGARSTARKALGIELTGTSFSERWLIIDLSSTANRFRHTEVFCDPRRACITLPGPNGIRRYEFSLRDDEDDELAESETFARKLLGSIGPDRDAPIRRQRAYTFHARVAERWRDGRVFLAGDAAHLSPPFAGQGMNSGIRDAHNLAWKLAEAAKGTVPESFLDSYETERKAHAWSMIELALTMGRIMLPTSAWRGVLTRAGFRLLGLYGPARDYFAQMRFKPKPRFTEGLLWPDQPAAATTMVGRLIPQPIVEGADRRRSLLDDVLPDQTIALVYSERPEEELSCAAERAIQDAGVAVIGLTPDWTNPVQARFPVYRDASRAFSTPPLAGYRGCALLLRRDRYVAATRPLASAVELAALAGALSPAQDKKHGGGKP